MALGDEKISNSYSDLCKFARVSSLSKVYQLALTKVNSDSGGVDAENLIQFVVPCLTSIDYNASLTFVDSLDDDQLSSEEDDRPSILASVIFCLYCRCPEFLICSSAPEPQVSTLYATNYAISGTQASDFMSKLSERNRSSSVDDEMSVQANMDLVLRLQGLRLAEDSEEVVDVDKNHLPPSLKLDWTRTRNKLKQSLNEALAEIELAKKCEIQRLIQLENEKAAKRKAEVTGLFSALEECVAQLPRSMTRHASTSDQIALSSIRSGSTQSSFKLFGSNRSNQNLSDEGIENDGGDDEPFVLDRSSVDEDDLEDPLMFSDTGASSPKVAVNTDEFSDEDDEEDTFLTESSGGSSSGIDGTNYNTMTSNSINMGTGRSKAGVLGSAGGGTFQNTPSSKPIQIGSVTSHSNRSASIALDNDEDQPTENIHERMRELSKSVRLGTSDIFGDLPDDHRRLDIAQLVRSYNSSNQDLIMYNRDMEPNF